MIRSIVVHDIPADSVAAMERWYHRVHAPEIVRRYGPWLARHESFVPVPPPPEAAALRRVRLAGHRLLVAGDPGARSAGRAVLHAAAGVAAGRDLLHPGPADERLPRLGHAARGARVFRWHVLLRYPDGVTAEEGERWFLQTHAPEVCELPGLRRFFSYRVIDEPVRLPGVWRDGGAPPPETVQHEWHRLSELWFDSFSDWRAAVVAGAAC